METTFLHNGTVAVIRMKRGENRINVDFLIELNLALDQVELNKEVKLLITTGNGHIYSNGMDVAFMTEQPDKLPQLGRRLFSTFIRLITFPVITVAAINGHAFAGGAMLALTHDLRIMRMGRGWICLNEVLINMQISPGLVHMVKSKVASGQVEHALMVLGKRFTAEEAKGDNLVNETCGGDDLLDGAVNLGMKYCGKQTYDRDMLQMMKCDVYRQTIEVLQGEIEQATQIEQSGQLIKSRL